MTDIALDFERDGFVVIEKILSEPELVALIRHCESEINVEVGTRNLLSFDWAKELAQKLILNDVINSVLPEKALAIQCNYFSKDEKKNWFVSLHRDKSIPIAFKVDSDKWSGWSEKEGTLYAQPPKQVLEEMVAIRIHLENNDSSNGALEVVPGSHRTNSKDGLRKTGVVSKGGALIMRPLILHKSTKVNRGKRRVLHFVFGPEILPNNAEWANAM